MTNNGSARVKVIDAIMGSGKTTWMIQEMKRMIEQQAIDALDGSSDAPSFLYITPTLDEVTRIQNDCPEMGFVDPVPVNGRKLNHLKELLQEEENICTTHALFSMINRDVYDVIAKKRYVLVIDESLDCVEQFKLGEGDKRILFENNIVFPDERKRLRWNHENLPDDDHRFNDIRGLCDNGNLIQHRDGILIWEFPVDILQQFQEVYVLTYLFHGSHMRHYFDLYRIDYQMHSIAGGQLVEFSEVDEESIKSDLKDKINIVSDEKLNAIGTPRDKKHPLSVSWFDRQRRRGDQDRTLHNLKRNTENFFRHHANTPSKSNMWTTFRANKSSIQGKAYTRGFVPINCKGTNDYIDKKSVAYLANIFVSPVLVRYFEEQDIPFDQDAFALNEMLQFVWRSQIRRGDPIDLYVPSQRMRELFLKWLEADSHGNRHGRSSSIRAQDFNGLQRAS